MNTSFFKVCFLALISFAFVSLITSCSESDELELVSVEDYVDEAMFDMEAAGKIGRNGCFDLVFPVTINFPDGSSVSVDDYDAMKDALKTWKEANPDAEAKPSLGFPLEVISEDGETITVDDRDGLKVLRRKCHRAFHDRPWRPGHRLHHLCFKPVFPLSVEFPNGSILEAATPRTLKNALRAWRRSVDNPQAHPVLIFPITIEYKDGTLVEVGSKEELKELKKQCYDGE